MSSGTIIRLWCDNQSLDKDGKISCLAHLAEARVLSCPYTDEADRRASTYPCSDYKPINTVVTKPNVLTVKMENCKHCPYFYTAHIYTSDSFEHESGAYCKLVEDTSRDGFGKNGKHRLIATDEWDVTKYTQIPNWCPLLAVARDSTINMEELETRDPKTLYAEYKKYLASYLESFDLTKVGDSPMSFDEWKSKNNPWR